MRQEHSYLIPLPSLKNLHWKASGMTESWGQAGGYNQSTGPSLHPEQSFFWITLLHSTQKAQAMREVWCRIKMRTK
jgi:hypothetical protein